MELIHNSEKLQGKRVAYARYVNFDECIAIVFDDETYVVITTEEEYDTKSAILCKDVEDYVKCQAGVMSDDEYEKIKKQKKEAQKRNEEKRERRQLERLQRKYEDKS